MIPDSPQALESRPVLNAAGSEHQFQGQQAVTCSEADTRAQVVCTMLIRWSQQVILLSPCAGRSHGWECIWMFLTACAAWSGSDMPSADSGSSAAHPHGWACIWVFPTACAGCCGSDMPAADSGSSAGRSEGWECIWWFLTACPGWSGWARQAQSMHFKHQQPSHLKSDWNQRVSRDAMMLCFYRTVWACVQVASQGGSPSGGP